MISTSRAAAVAILLCVAHGARAAPAFSCGGFALLGGAQLACSHTDPAAPTQICTFSWSLLRTDNTVFVVQGSFLLAPGVSNLVVYQGSGFAAEASNPIVLCQNGSGAP